MSESDQGNKIAKTTIFLTSSTAPIPSQDYKKNAEQLHAITLSNAIKQVIISSTNRDQFEPFPEFNLLPTQLQKTFISYEPDIFHYFGHGEKDCLTFQNEDGSLSRTKLKPFVDAIKLFNESQQTKGGNKIRLVILVACNSDEIAKAVSENVECAIGISNQMPEDAGIAFSRQFYSYLCEGENVKYSFDCAINDVALSNLNKDDKPKIFPENRDFSSLIFGVLPKVLEFPNSEFPEMKYTFNNFPAPFISKENNLDFIIAYGAGKRDYDAYIRDLKKHKYPVPELQLYPGRRSDFDYLPRLIAYFSFCAAKNQSKVQSKISNTGQLLLARQSFLLSDDEKKENIIAVGSGAVNQITREVLEKWGKILPVKFETPQTDQRILFPAGDKKSYIKNEEDEKDVGFIELVPNPYNPEKVVLIVAGLAHTGTQAAILALCKEIEDGDKLSDQFVEFRGKKQNFPVQLLKAADIIEIGGNCIVQDVTLLH